MTLAQKEAARLRVQRQRNAPLIAAAKRANGNGHAVPAPHADLVPEPTLLDRSLMDAATHEWNSGYEAGRRSAFAELMHTLADRMVGERGQGLAEYALILALVGIVAIVALGFLGGQIGVVLSTVGQSLADVLP